MPTVDKTGLIVGIETSASEIIVICVIKEEFHQYLNQITESINLSEKKIK